ncbi:T9SS type A sorting domain-containing protein [Chryseolinea sp. T2]|uniref:T9SS type A sorting domain-containing protein n=1 Tax=Chryseolinea sp. T2 TaxID=3129255 RepID=UPI003077B9A5
MLRTLILIFTSFAIVGKASATTYYTTAAGNITGSIWATTTNGTGGFLPALVAGDVIVIDDNVQITSNFMDWNSVTITINLYSIINFNGGKLDLATNSIIDFKTSSAKITSVGGGASDKIRFGNGSVWDGDDPDITGPGIMNKNYVAGGPLPIELIFFNVKQTGAIHSLEWATASERNFAFFSVEHSTDGINFKEIEQVKGHGTTMERKDYSFENRNPCLGKNYYRLKSVDFDGSSEYSEVAFVDHIGEKIFMVTPNPSTGSSISISMNFVPEENTHVTIFNNTGIVVGVYEPTDSFQSISFQNSLTTGLYFARLVSRSYVKVERFVVR